MTKSRVNGGRRKRAEGGTTTRKTTTTIKVKIGEAKAEVKAGAKAGAKVRRGGAPVGPTAKVRIRESQTMRLNEMNTTEN